MLVALSFLEVLRVGFLWSEITRTLITGHIPVTSSCDDFWLFGFEIIFSDIVTSWFHTDSSLKTSNYILHFVDQCIMNNSHIFFLNWNENLIYLEYFESNDIAQIWALFSLHHVLCSMLHSLHSHSYIIIWLELAHKLLFDCIISDLVKLQFTYKQWKQGRWK